MGGRVTKSGDALPECEKDFLCYTPSVLEGSTFQLLRRMLALVLEDIPT